MLKISRFLNFLSHRLDAPDLDCTKFSKFPSTQKPKNISHLQIRFSRGKYHIPRDLPKTKK